METGLDLLVVPVGAVSRDVSPDLYCNEVMTASPKPSPINERSWCVKSDFPFFLGDVPRKEKLCDKGHWDCASCAVRRAGADFEQQHGPDLNAAFGPHNEKGPFQLHNWGKTNGVVCFDCLTANERDAPDCSCMEPIELGDPGRPLRRIQRHKIPAHAGEDFDARYDEADRKLSCYYVGAGPFRYVGAGPRYEKEPQHPTRPGDKDGEGGAAWRWEQLYFEHEVGKACRCVGEMCECDYSNTKMMPDELNKRRKKLRATDPCRT